MDQKQNSESNLNPDKAGAVPGEQASDRDLTPQLSRIEEKVSLVESLQKSKRHRIWFFSLLIFANAVWFIWAILQPVHEIYKNPDVFLQAVKHEEITTFLPILRYEFNQEIPKLYSALDKAFQTEWAKRAGKLPSLKDELNLALNQVTTHLGREGAVRVSLLRDRYQRKVEKDFPEIAADEDAMEAINLGLHGALNSVIGTRLKRPYETLISLRDSFNALPVPENLRNMSDVQLQEVVIERIHGYLNAHFRPLMDNIQTIRQQVSGFEYQFLDMKKTVEDESPVQTEPQKE